VRVFGIAGLLLLVLMGCPLEPRVVDLRPDTGQAPGPDDSRSWPAVRVSTSGVDFGAVAVGEHHEKTLEIMNVGDSTLSIEEVGLVESDVPFSFEQLELAWIEPEQSATLVMAFEPISHGPTNGTLSIGSDDPSQPIVTVDLNGVGMVPELRVEPAEVALGPTWIGCSVGERLVLVNAGNEGLLISAVGFETAGDEIQLTLAETTNGPLPWSLGAESTLELGTVGHVPQDERRDLAYLTVVSSDDRVEDLRVDVTAEASAWDTGVDSYTVPLGVVDVVVALDRSTSMDVYMGDLLAGLPALVSGLADRGLDLQLVVVVDDDGCVNGELPWIDGESSTSQVRDALAAMATHHGGGSLMERAYLQLQAALSAGNLGAAGCNEGLLRERAALHLVGISDELEQSSDDWGDHVTALQALRVDPAMVVFHAIAGNDSGCGEQAFDGFDDAVDLTGGSLVSLCSDDLAGDLDLMANAMAGVAGEPVTEGPYVLNEQPVALSIELRVDDARVFDGWSYDTDANSVSFDAVAAPSPGAVVEVSYAVRPDDCSAP